MNESDKRALVAYRTALIAMIQNAGGELFVPCDTAGHEAGTILWKAAPGGLRFRYHPEGTKQ